MIRKRIYLSPPHLGEEEWKNVKDTFADNWVSTAGANIAAFEKAIADYTNGGHCAVFNTGTAAIHLALILLGIQKGDEVICSSFTFSASANPVVYQGATPVFVDSEPDSWNMSPELLKQALKDRLVKGKKPKAIIVVHLYGMPAKINEIIKIAEEYSVPVIEDAAESLGSTYQGKMTGTFGKFGIYSFNGNKIITTSGGGALISSDEALIRKSVFLATQARDKAPHYQHSETGYNYRMSNVLAGIGLGQMKVLKDRILKRREIFEFYKNAFRSSGLISFSEEQPEMYSNRWLTTILFEKSSVNMPGKVHEALEAINIESRALWKPMHLQPVFKDAPFYANGISEDFFKRGLCLPSGTAMTTEDLETVCQTVLKCIE